MFSLDRNFMWRNSMICKFKIEPPWGTLGFAVLLIVYFSADMKIALHGSGYVCLEHQLSLAWSPHTLPSCVWLLGSSYVIKWDWSEWLFRAPWKGLVKSKIKHVLSSSMWFGLQSVGAILEITWQLGIFHLLVIRLIFSESFLKHMTAVWNLINLSFGSKSSFQNS